MSAMYQLYTQLSSFQPDPNTPCFPPNVYGDRYQITFVNGLNQTQTTYVVVQHANHPSYLEANNATPRSPVIQPIPHPQNRIPVMPPLQLQLKTICEGKETQFPTVSPSPPLSNASPSIHASEFVPSWPSPPSSPSISPLPCASPSPPSSRRRVKCKELFVAKYPHRAQLNVYIPQDITSSLLDLVSEQFPSPQSLYYYMDISTALQLNDAQMYRFEIEDDEVVFVNYDLHTKATGDPMYGVIGLNDGHNNRKDKWCWKLLGFKTATEIFECYGVCYNELPLSSRRMDYFQKQYESQRNPVIDARVIDTTDWGNIRQIKSLRRRRDRRRYGDLNIVMRVDRNAWIKQCKELWNAAPVIPIVVNGGKCNEHWIEWVKLITFRNNERIGIACRYLEEYGGEWVITSICLDKGDLQNKHRLLGLIAEDDKQMYVSYFDNFNATFTEIQWIRSKYKGIVFH